MKSSKKEKKVVKKRENLKSLIRVSSRAGRTTPNQQSDKRFYFILIN